MTAVDITTIIAAVVTAAAMIGGAAHQILKRIAENTSETKATHQGLVGINDPEHGLIVPGIFQEVAALKTDVKLIHEQATSGPLANSVRKVEGLVTTVLANQEQKFLDDQMTRQRLESIEVGVRQAMHDGSATRAALDLFVQDSYAQRRAWREALIGQGLNVPEVVPLAVLNLLGDTKEGT